ncbi:hypothetical protein ABID82_004476 [Methylobacterium sp. PvP062]|jgi:hypothetical protein|uniref:Uncharacterized protein n=1 Tax=Methylobacterium radiotolerans TaxID=31998 RepID=A0ABV2NKV2_9HYPH|nr:MULTISPECIES: hypothetical protein [unclassified Methylobacterium]MBP2496133.1 hypothetical protein [Methylobacterium sp. PvP105]MBP2503995.1 hypothetical protein [Methylobacterium sp. PvP109]MCX7335536.1 hypothetical protein [Hyphomicrobiales bacterium]
MLKVLVFATLLAALAVPASAMPLVQNAVSDRSDGAQIIQVYGGCGPYAHRGPYGGCRTGGQWGGYVRSASCPAGFHIGPYGRRCWPN